MASALNGSVFIARDLHDYQQLAIQLASQRGAQVISRWKSQEARQMHEEGARVGSETHTRSLESMFHSMWEEFRARRHSKQRAGRTPKAFVLSVVHAEHR
mmetsp:Transcript_42255/g.133131  ORF Transcript_42255/g.133131 Transcript_42255/m.133131 type:complete len:100 (-) Transcript_42255:110-409(-)